MSSSTQSAASSERLVGWSCCGLCCGSSPSSQSEQDSDIGFTLTRRSQLCFLLPVSPSFWFQSGSYPSFSGRDIGWSAGRVASGFSPTWRCQTRAGVQIVILWFMTMLNQSAAGIHCPALPSNSSGNLSATLAAARAFPVAVAEPGS